MMIDEYQTHQLMCFSKDISLAYIYMFGDGHVLCFSKDISLIRFYLILDLVYNNNISDHF